MSVELRGASSSDAGGILHVASSQRPGVGCIDVFCQAGPDRPSNILSAVAADHLADGGRHGHRVARGPTASAASVCQDSSPAGTYVVRVCIDSPADGSSLSGKANVSGSVSVVSGTGPGFQRMVFSLDGQYLLTDYSTPYTFTLDTRRFIDGSHTMTAHALLRDTNTTPDTTVGLTFNNGITTPPVNTRTFTPPQGNPVVRERPLRSPPRGTARAGTRPRRRSPTSWRR